MRATLIVVMLALPALPAVGQSTDVRVSVMVLPAATTSAAEPEPASARDVATSAASSAASSAAPRQAAGGAVRTSLRGPVARNTGWLDGAQSDPGPRAEVTVTCPVRALCEMSGAARSADGPLVRIILPDL